MKSIMRKTTLREIRQSLGRYLAIVAIVALGVGFFAGLRVTKTAMIKTGNEYCNTYQLSDFQLISTLGFEEEDVEAIEKMDEIRSVSGSVSTDVIIQSKDSSESVVKAHSIMNQINMLKVVEGRLPQSSDECVIDVNMVTEKIGNTITISADNKEETSDLFADKEYTIVGTVQTPAYLNFERGNTSLGNGQVSGFIYFMPESFDLEYYTEIFVTFDQDYEIYSSDYEAYIDEKTSLMEDICEERTDLRFQEILGETKDELLLAGMPEAQADETLSEIEEPSFYVFTREDNIGYVFFENDAAIVEGISTVFPVFFFLVAALVCITTMNRMVDEQRTQIGILKALGYSKAAIMNKYTFYSGSAALIGCISGFMLGSYLFPVTIWKAYNIMYGFTDKVLFVFDIPLAIISLTVALLCSIGATYFSCYYELNSVAAQLIRPKSPKSGKRIFLERIG
ncbi:MAG: FtsX-like permease family protein, partial [Clostridiales bacterium]|nr:FtsX-like permease family protein [Clostridiales bacterium]